MSELHIFFARWRRKTCPEQSCQRARFFFFFPRESRGVVALNGPRHIASVGLPCIFTVWGFKWTLKPMVLRARARAQTGIRMPPDRQEWTARQWSITRRVTSANMSRHNLQFRFHYRPMVRRCATTVASLPCARRTRIDNLLRLIEYQ